MIDATNSEILTAPIPIPSHFPIVKLIKNKTILINVNAIGKSTLFSIRFEMNERRIITIIKIIVRTTRLNISPAPFYGILQNDSIQKGVLLA